jgi:putative oxidoreductase
MFLLFAYDKITAYAGTVCYMSSLGLPVPSLFTLLAIIIEIGGGLLMLVGYQTRLVAVLAIYVQISAFIGHFQLGDFNQYQHFMKNMAIVGGALAFVAFGGGAYSLDASKSSKQLRVT